MQFSQIEKSRTHLALYSALAVSENPQNVAERVRRGYAFWASHDPSLLHEAGVLALALSEYTQRPSFCFRMPQLEAAADSREMARCAAELLGAVNIGRDVWSTAPDENAPRVAIPSTLFRDYLEDWACHLPFDEESKT